MACSTLEQQLNGLYVVDQVNGGFIEASFNDVVRYLKMCGLYTNAQTHTIEDRYYYFWTAIFIMIVLLIVYCIR